MGDGVGRHRHGYVPVRHQALGLGRCERDPQHDHEGASRMSVRKSESGQAIVLMALSLVVIMGMAALVVDVGNWYHTKRRLQGTADAAALAGAQLLPDDPSGAQTMAMNYANQNGGDVAGANIIVTSTVPPNDTISDQARETDPG